MAYADYTILYDGTNGLIDVTFPYLDPAHVQMFVNDVPHGFRWIDDNTVTPDPLPSQNSYVRIKRSTSPGQRLVDYRGAAALLESDLDLDSLQALYLVQELSDELDGNMSTDAQSGGLNAQGKRVVNVAPPSGPNDAATKDFVENGVTSVYQKAQAIKDEIHTLAPSVVPIPTDNTPFVEYNPNDGKLKFYIPKGERGAVGDPGATGPRGVEGPKGDAGLVGPMGPQGVKGDQGIRGPEGPQGLTGPQGQQGERGIRGEQGNPGDVGPQGPDGDKGPTGDKGPVGDQGPVGPTGDKGPQGDVGPQGPDGNQGPMGETPMGLAFGQLRIEPATGELVIEHYGEADGNDFEIDENGILKVTI